MTKNYETLFVLNPALSVGKAKDACDKFVGILTDAKADIVNLEQWGIKKMAYPIQKKSTGFYNLVEFTAETSVIKTFETELRRDESVLRFLTVTLDKYALEYNRRRRNGEFNKQKKKSNTEKEKSNTEKEKSNTEKEKSNTEKEKSNTEKEKSNTEKEKSNTEKEKIVV